ncbi:tapasin-related protein [Anguilla rostrata]|uniref:tapasin-related protein n=1 Tax=Anguilla rostrata TaxID=7938 RepID=UPI0030D50084
MMLSFIVLLSTFIYSVLLQEVSWLPCELVEEQVQMDVNGHMETQYRHRNAVLQFGQPGDHAMNPDSITFFVSGTGKKLDIRRYVDLGVEPLQCEIRRYSTGGIQVLWPGRGAQEQDIWFTCTLHHSGGHFVLTTFLRHTPPTPTNAQEDHTKMHPIGDKDSLVTTVGMLVLTQTPSVEVGLLREQILHCQFVVDHARPELVLEWTLRRRGERSKLFHYSSKSGQSEGSGVSLSAIAKGDGSLRLPAVSLASEGTYTCSVYVPPLYATHDVVLQIVESPQVSLNVGASLTLQEGQEQKVVCEAQGYYPLDVQLEWLKEQRGGSRLPEVLKNVLFSSHRHHNDGTYSLSIFFLLHPTPMDSGCTYTCRVSHRSLRVPIRKSFTLTVTETADWGSVLLGVVGIGFAAVMLAFLLWMLHYLHTAKQEAKKRKPY